MKGCTCVLRSWAVVQNRCQRLYQEQDGALMEPAHFMGFQRNHTAVLGNSELENSTLFNIGKDSWKTMGAMEPSVVVVVIGLF